MEIKLLICIRGGFCDLVKDCKFKHDFRVLVDLICNCGNNIESKIHFLLHCANFTTQRQTLMNKIDSIYANILAETETSII